MFIEAYQLAPPEFVPSVINPLMQKYPEISWFADPNVAITQEKPNAALKPGWTQLLSEKGLISVSVRVGYKSDSNIKYIELERMLSSLHCFYIFHQGGQDAYTRFIAPQKSSVALHPASFQELHHWAKQVGQRKHGLELMMAGLIYSDLGKTPTARASFELVGGKRSKSDHDDFMEALLSLGKDKIEQILPSYPSLSASTQSLLIKISQAMTVHLGHVMHQEGGEGMFKAFAQAVQSGHVTQETFEVARLIHHCDVAASAAHINFSGSLSLNEDTYQAYRLVMECLQAIRNGQEVKTAFFNYQSGRAQMLGLELDSKEEQLITRFGCLLRLYSPKAGTALFQAYHGLTSEKKSLLNKQFDPAVGINKWQRNPTYLPTVLLNLAHFSDPAEPTDAELTRALEGAVSLAYFFEKEASQFQNSLEPLNCNHLALLATKQPKIFELENFKAEYQAGNIIVASDGTVELKINQVQTEKSGKTPRPE